jgi:DNA-binding response OmpR family regulator
MADSAIRRRPGRVLIIDDEADLAQAIERFLSDENDVTVAHDADEAILLAARRSFDAILCDVKMPTSDGVDFHQRMLAIDPAAAKRVIFMTGGALSDRQTKYFDSISNLLLVKPFDLMSFKELVRRRVRSPAAVAARATR